MGKVSVGLFLLLLSLVIISYATFSTPVACNFHEPPAVMQIVSPANNTTYNQTTILLNVAIQLRQYRPANSTFEFEDMLWLNYSR
jgi:hypothetical protein